MITRCVFGGLARFERWRLPAYLLLALAVVVTLTIGNPPATGIVLLVAGLLPMGLLLPLAEAEDERERVLAVAALWTCCCGCALVHLDRWPVMGLLAGTLLLGLMVLPFGFQRRPASGRRFAALGRPRPWRWLLALPLATGLILLATLSRPEIRQDQGLLINLPALRAVLVTATVLLVATARPWTGTVFLLGFLAALGGLRACGLAEIDGADVALLLPWYAMPFLAAEVCRGNARRTWFILAVVLWLIHPAILLGCIPSERLPIAAAFSGWLLVVLPGALVLTDPGRCPGRNVQQACAILPPAWRWYARIKLKRDPVYLLLRREKRPWGRVLDAGCGIALGGLIAYLRGDATSYHGVDLDAGKLAHGRLLMAALGRNLNDDWRLTCARLPEECPRDAVDTILLLDVLHYWPPAIQGELLRHLREILAPDGVLYLRDGLVDDPDALVLRRERLAIRVGINPGEAGLHFLDRPAFEALLTASGFTIDGEWEAGGDNRLFRCRLRTR